MEEIPGMARWECVEMGSGVISVFAAHLTQLGTIEEKSKILLSPTKPTLMYSIAHRYIQGWISQSAGEAIALSGKI